MRLFSKINPPQAVEIRGAPRGAIAIIPYWIPWSQEQAPKKFFKALILSLMVDKIILHYRMEFIAGCSGKPKREACFLWCFLNFCLAFRPVIV
jgi:hypothetical protein